MKTIALIVTLLCGAGLLFVAGGFPDWGDPNSPASTHVSDYYIEHTMEDTSVPNAVTSILADYRGFDTMFETSVIFTAALACFMLLRVLGTPENMDETLYRHRSTGIVLKITGKAVPVRTPSFIRVESHTARYDFIVSRVSRLLIPFIQLFALYVVAHGHHSPGGGFQGGVILGASVLLLALSHDLRTACERFPERPLFLMLALGVLIYTGTGAVCMLYGQNFLDYGALAPLLHVDPIQARSLGIFFVEIGVAFTVMSTMVLIYSFISSRGRCDRGL